MGTKQEGNEYFTSHIAKLLDSWETAGIRGAKKKAEEAEQRIGDLPVRMTAPEHNELVRGYDDAHEEGLEERETPANFVIEAQKAQLQNGSLIAQRLSSVASREETPDEDVDLTPRIRADGSLKITVGKTVTVPLPEDPEDLRYRVKLLGVSWGATAFAVPFEAIAASLVERVLGRSRGMASW